MSVVFDSGLPETLLSRVEDAGLNASAPPQQRWVDGWLLRYSPAKAKRARCINPVADGRLPVEQRLACCQAVFDEAGLPMILRLTPFSRPAGLDALLAAQGLQRFDDTRVMVAAHRRPGPAALPAGVLLERLGPEDYAEHVGALRGSPAGQRAAHAERLKASPVPYEGWMLRRRDDGALLAMAQTATEGELVGLYDVFTPPEHRGQGLARQLCAALMAQASDRGARVAYLQVDGDNVAARAVYRRLGFVDAYGYHYRAANPALA